MRPGRITAGKAATHQQGAVLVVAMIVLVALGLAALSLLRSVDVLGLVSGNLSYQRSAMNSTDVGLNAAMTKLEGVALRADPLAANCYSEIVLPTDTRGIPTVLDNTTTFEAAYPGCVITTATDEKVYFIIDRQCTASAIPDSKNCSLAQTKSQGGDTLDLQKGRVIPTYRITARVDGTKKSSSYSQTITY